MSPEDASECGCHAVLKNWPFDPPFLRALSGAKGKSMKALSFPTLLALAALFALAGCGRSLHRKYSGSAYGAELLSADFQSGDKVFVSTMAGTTQGTYKIEGDRVIITANGQNLVFTLASDGSLTGGPMGVALQPVK